jgi:hypothetical protein
MNSRREGGRFGEHAERPESVGVFRHLLCRAPDIVADEIDVFPAKRGQMVATFESEPCTWCNG